MKRKADIIQDPKSTQQPPIHLELKTLETLKWLLWIMIMIANEISAYSRNHHRNFCCFTVATLMQPVLDHREDLMKIKIKRNIDAAHHKKKISIW